MANILTITEAANVLRCDESDPNLIDLLPAIDRYVWRATGHDWASDETVAAEAKSAARMLLVQWHEDPGAMGAAPMQRGLTACLAQLETLALRYKRFAGQSGAGPVSVPGAQAGDTVTALVGLVGVTGDQSASFESVITVDDEIQQVSTADLSDYWYQAHLTPLGG